MKDISEIDKRLRMAHPLVFIVFMLCAIYLPIAIAAVFVTPGAEIDVAVGMQRKIWECLLGVLIVPIIETAILQYAVIKGLRRIFKVGDRVLIVISAVLYGLAHPPLQEMWLPALNGLVLAYAFVAYEHDERVPGFLMTLIIAMARNLPVLSVLCGD